MRIMKQDEMEQFHTTKASRYAFLTYTVILLGWSLYNRYTIGQMGDEFLILMIGNAVYFWTLVIEKRKIERFEETDPLTTMGFIRKNKSFIIWGIILMMIIIVGLLTK